MACRILIANSNTNAAMTERMLEVARRWASVSSELHGATASYGSAAIQSTEEVAIAARATAEMVEAADVDVAIIACFADPGLEGIRQRSPIPVLGLAEAAAHVAAAVATRFSVITVRGQSEVLASNLLCSYGFAPRLASVRGIDSSLCSLGENPERFREAIRLEALLAHTEDGAQAVVLGGAFFVGIAEHIRTPIPLIDPLVAALKVAEAAVSPAKTAAMTAGGLIERPR